MKIELRKRLHENHTSFHYDIILIPDDREAQLIDEAVNDSCHEIKISGEITVDDYFGRYIRIQIEKG